MSKFVESLSRREMLRRTVGAGLSVLSVPMFTNLIDADAQSIDVESAIFAKNSKKFAPDGTVRRFAGDTIICHLPKDSTIFRELVSVHKTWTKHSFARCLAVLPTSSYHSTIFSGANDQEREVRVWPDDVPLDTPIEECDRLLEAKLRSARFPLSLPLRFRIDTDLKDQALDTSTSTIRLLPFNDAEDRKVRDLRDRLSDLLKIRSIDHDDYRFHISLGYWVQPVTPAELEDYHRTLSAALARLTSVVHSIDFQAPQYCTFDNMLAFSPKLWLNFAA